MLIFDFDGVLMDSMDEAGVTGYNAVTGRRLTALDAVPPAVARRFRRNRFLTRNSAELFALMAWCIETERAPAPRRARLGRSGFEALLGRSPVSPAERSTRFFEARRRFMETDRSAWLGLHRPFQPIWDQLARRDALPVVILTSKNRAAVLALSAHFELFTAPENVYSGDGGTGKTENLRALHRRFNRPRYRFLDDALGNLRRLDADFNPGRRLVDLTLAAWGYVGPGDAAEARRLGYEVLQKPDRLWLP